jgi:cyclopropane-fatty-acyl-phospholipid synthase
MSGYRGASAAAIRHHYDIGNDFYALWLDSTLTYSCALWEDGEDSLQSAQERKLDRLAEAARAGHAERVLDIGCGWGSMIRRLVQRHSVEHVVGLTLSAAQAEYAQAWDDDRFEVRVENWAEHSPERPYDAIVSVGAFEHFADFGMTRAARVDSYRHFFARCHEWLPPRGRLALQTNTKGNNARLDQRTVRDLMFIVRHIFPESELPWTSEILEASERRFDVVCARNDPEHYARTCRVWLEGLRANREAAGRLVGKEILADYERYLQAAGNAFTKRHLGLARIVFERI